VHRQRPQGEPPRRVCRCVPGRVRHLPGVPGRHHLAVE
jgi:hypothetical protein